MTPKELLSDQIKAEIERGTAACQDVANKNRAALLALVNQIEPVIAPSPIVYRSTLYRSQWEKGAEGFRCDCGPACVGMLMEHKSLPRVSIDKISVAAGMTATKTGTTGVELANAASQFGLQLEVVRGWTLDQFKSHLPAIILVHYGSIPNRVDDNYKVGHWMVLTGIGDILVMFHDPDWWPPRLDEGANRSLPRVVFEKAIADCALDKNPVGHGLVLAGTAR